MTNKLAKELFDALVEQIQDNGFSDIFTFTIREASDELRYSKFSGEYAYASTDAAMQNLIIMSDNSDLGATRALDTLVQAGEEYFSTVSKIPGKYADQINTLFKESDSHPPVRIMMYSSNDKEIDLSEALNNDAVHLLTNLMRFFRRNMQHNDEEFLRYLAEFLNELP
jgi:hypothetical protein